MRFVRAFLWIIALIALIFLGCVVALFLLVTPDKVQERLQVALSEADLTLQMSEQAEVKVLPTIQVTLPAAQILDSENRVVASLRTAYFDISPWWLLLGKVHIQTLDIDGLDFNIRNRSIADISQIKTEKTAIFSDVSVETLLLNNARLEVSLGEKTLQLTNMQARVASPAPQMHAPFQILSQVAFVQNGESFLLDTDLAATLDLNLATGAVIFENLIVQAKGTQNGAPVELSFSSPLLQISNDRLYTKTSQFQLQQPSQSREFQLSSAELNITEQAVQAPDIHTLLRHGAGNEKFELDVRSPVNFNRIDGTFDASHLQGHVLLPHAAQTSPLSGQIKGSISQKHFQVSLYSRFNEAPFSFQGEWDGLDKPRITGEVVIGRLKASDIALLSNVSPRRESDDRTFSNDAASTAKPSGSEPNNVNDMPQEEPAATPQTAPAEVAENASSAPTPSPQEDLGSTAEVSAPEYDFDLFDKVDFDGNVVVGELQIGELRLLQTKAPLVIRDGRLQWSGLRSIFYDGRSEADISITSEGHWSLSFNADNVNLQNLTADAGATDSVGGVLNVQAHFFGEGLDEETVSGQVGFAVTNTRFYGLQISDALSSIAKYQPVKADAKAFTDVEKLNGVATVREGLVNLSPLSVRLAGSRLEGNAALDVSTASLKGSLDGTVRGLKTKLYLSGPWYQPMIAVNDEEIKSANQIEAPAPKPEPPKEPTRWEKLKNFFSNYF